MCGIIGIVGTQSVSERLVDSLKRLEYRGYDSAGVAAVVGGKVERRRAQGKIKNLEAVLADEPLDAQNGIGHVRWATHGAPNVKNAHPHTAGRVTLVHNGIIENFAELKVELAATGRVFESDTDTEVIAQLIDAELATGLPPLEAFKATLDRLTGAFALAVLIEGADNLILGARRGSPLVVGEGQGEMFLGSDALAVGPFTNRVIYLEEGDYVAIDHDSARIFDVAGAPVVRPVKVVPASVVMMEKGNYRHFMEKEIHDQPEGCQRTISAYVDALTARAAMPGDLDFKALERIQIVACGTSYIAGVIGKYLIEQLADLPVDVEIASEFRYRQPALRPGSLVIAMSQSGETADTLAALRYCKAKGMKSAVVVNAQESTMAREVDVVWPIHCGPEIGVASTKAFTAQVSVMIALAVAAAKARGMIDAAEEQRMVKVMLEAPRLIAEAIGLEDALKDIAVDIAKARDVLFLGRGPMSALALEGALKLKEISYIHAEGYAAGELKHGPIALVDDQTPIIILAPYDSYFEKSASNMSEVMARGGQVVFITDPQGAKHAPAGARVVVTAPASDPLVSTLVMAAPIQLLAYHVAVVKGADVDQPRNLAKSVTVE
ncbi:glucosamine--fructose-6-phosphate aminotransferase [Caulobacter sp. Root1455]|uniref:glutamine--fructose-6-phosphate transaminase (isomerizing) n=1 Tax=unclassified Caulobacter TaxID=2648921 RepID=UPI0006F2EDE2|nr:MULTISPECIES: glutamine--fructose-6-phosphate transaminase (isomerizing) [unclassified Caulobacter]KQY35406.1 glucosamine--fructose-6-phosphate aminotransferase [Caulobacter sp. Root487D2Y]KQY93384.1 glucosamine--fructose-6-phosphate aminotransferase [Caulobacter sp. Root1455]